MDKRISEAIKDAMADSTLTAASLEKFTDLAAKVDELESLNSYLRGNADDLEKDKRELEEALRAANKKIDELHSREESLESREASVTELEKNAAVATAVSEAWKDAFDKVFRNATLRRETMKQVFPPSGEYGMTPPSESVTDFETETEE